LQISSILTARYSVAHPSAPVPSASPPVAPSAARGVSTGLHCDHCGQDGHVETFSTGRKKLRCLRLVVLHKVLVALVLEDLRGVLLVQRHRSCSCYFVVLRPLHRQELLVL
jgi:hypothetical protein